MKQPLFKIFKLFYMRETHILSEEIFAGIDFREFFFGHFAGIDLLRIVFTEDFAGINFCELSLTKDFAVNSRKCPLQRFRGSKFNVRLKEYFFHDLSLWFWEQSQWKLILFYLNKW